MFSEKLEYFDISPEISPQLAVFPGDQVFEREIALDFKKGNHLLLSQIRATLHLGAHVDAPNHYHSAGAGIEARGLNYYLGDCQVIEVNLPRGERIYPSNIEGKKIQAPRILFKTKSFPNPNQWNGDFNSLSPELVEYLASKKVILIGIDTPSIDLADDQILPSHQAIYRQDMAVLEGVVLSEIAEGLYTLVALPLKIKSADASPVRAILLPIGKLK